MKLIALGAEAEIYENGDEIIKMRVSKSYRIPEIDAKIIKSRVKREAKIIEKLYLIGFNTPKLISVEGSSITMENIKGIVLKKYINDTNYAEFMKQVGTQVAKLHNHNIIHGDLTTLNFIVKDNQLYLIDFGLSFFSSSDEDKAVDLYVFEKALKCEHDIGYINFFYEGYNSLGSSDVIKRLEGVRRRGRKIEEKAFG